MKDVVGSSMSSRGRVIACLVGLFLLLLAGEAHADNLAGLVFVVFIWPIGILCGVALLILGIIGLVKLRRRRKASAYSTALLVVAIGAAVGYPVLTILLAGTFRARAPADIMVITLLPVELLAAGCIALGAVLRARAR
jgi:hypothetical protein